MATADAGPAAVRDHPRLVVAVLTVVGYTLVIGTIAVGLPIYPTISRETVVLLSHAIAAINTVTVLLLSAGWYWIRTHRVRRHRAAMIAAFSFIMLFLVLYLLKTGGGGRRDVVGGPSTLVTAYYLMLGVHIVLSILAVPVVLYALTLGLVYTPAELRGTIHARVGRVAAGTWIVSLVLGIGAYVVLNYGGLEIEFVRLTVRAVPWLG